MTGDGLRKSAAALPKSCETSPYFRVTKLTFQKVYQWNFKDFSSKFPNQESHTTFYIGNLNKLDDHFLHSPNWGP